jgi:NAD+ kinase
LARDRAATKSLSTASRLPALLKLLLVPRRGPERFVNETKRALDNLGSDYRVAYNGENKIAGADIDLALVIGDDKHFLRFLQSRDTEVPPTLCVGEMDAKGFLSETTVAQLAQVLPSVLKGEFRTEESMRLKVTVDGTLLPPALNEVAIFPSRSATLLEYGLSVDDETVWRDYGDGVIISTPTGSTAYAMSAGGPMIFHSSDVCAVVSVNSMDVTRRPLVVPSSATVNISEITSASRCEAIIDGTFRSRVLEEVSVTRHPHPARFVRLLKKYQTANVISKKIQLAEELLNMPASAKFILATLRYEGPLTQKELLKKTMLPDRTTRLSLGLLIERGLVERRSFPRDARQKVYQVAAASG